MDIYRIGMDLARPPPQKPPKRRTFLEVLREGGFVVTENTVKGLCVCGCVLD